MCSVLCVMCCVCGVLWVRVCVRGVCCACSVCVHGVCCVCGVLRVLCMHGACVLCVATYLTARNMDDSKIKQTSSLTDSCF